MKGKRQKKAKQDIGEKATMTMKSALPTSKGPLSEEGDTQQLLHVSGHTGGIIALLYSLNKYMGLPVYI